MTKDTAGSAERLDEGLLYECFRLIATFLYLVILVLIWLVGGMRLRCSLWAFAKTTLQVG
jgi:hypothetical protein